MTKKNLNMRYILCLQKAAHYIQRDLAVPEDIVREAIGEKPGTCDSPDSDTLLEEMQECSLYRKRLKAFMNSASYLAKS